MFSLRESFKSCDISSRVFLFKSVLDLDAMRLCLYAVFWDYLKFRSPTVVNIVVDSTLSIPLIIFLVLTRSRRFFSVF